MTQALALRRLVLTAHIAASLGWFGAVVAFLALAVAGMTSVDPHLTGAVDLGMGLVAWYAILPLNLAALATGLAQGMVSPWGLFRHYWVVVKLAITVLSTLLLLLHLQPIGVLAAAAQAPPTGVELGSLRVQMVVDAAAALAVLLVNTALSVYKPQGLTWYGWRKQNRAEAP